MRVRDQISDMNVRMLTVEKNVMKEVKAINGINEDHSMRIKGHHGNIREIQKQVG